MFEDLSNADGTLADLREHLKLPEHLPSIGTVHPVAIALDTNPQTMAENSTFVLCCHDDANHAKHIVHYPSGGVNEQNPGESQRIRGHVARIIGAAYN